MSSKSTVRNRSVTENPTPAVAAVTAATTLTEDQEQVVCTIPAAAASSYNLTLPPLSQTVGQQIYVDFTQAGSYVDGAVTVTDGGINIQGSALTVEVRNAGAYLFINPVGRAWVAAKMSQLDGGILADMATAEGAGIQGDALVCEHSVVKAGGIYKTEILLDLTGLTSTATDGDIIGDSGGGAAHIGQITAARNGTIIAGRITCFEAPATGDDDIAIYSATEATGAYDGAIGDLTETSLLDHGAWSVDELDYLDALPAADEYLYLVAKGGDTAGTHTAGILLIELWGK